MDLTLDDEQRAIADLAGRILGDLCTPERLRQHEATGEPTLAAAWAELAKADLIGVALPEDVGGGGYSVLEACLVAEEVGRAVAPVPYVPTLAAALVLAAHGDQAQRALAGSVADGSTILAPAMAEGGTDAAPAVPATVASADGEGWRLSGEKRFVAWGAQAARLVVPARTGEAGVALFVVDPAASGVTVMAEDALWGLPQATVELDGAPGDAVGPVEGGAAARHLADVATVLSCATVAGVCDGALRATAAHVSEREQFGTKIGTFQAVAQRCADAYIDTQAVRLTALQAAWRLSAGMPAADEIHVAKFWAADAGHRVVHAAQHLHGGVGMDLDYPVHRYFRWEKVLELHLGSATEHLRRLGASIAAEPV